MNPELFIPKYFENNARVLRSKPESTKNRVACDCGGEVFEYAELRFSLRPNPLYDMQLEVERRNGITFDEKCKHRYLTKSWSCAIYNGERYWLMLKEEAKKALFENGCFIKKPSFCDYFKESDALIQSDTLPAYDYITAKCKHCSKEILLFDSRYYGYDGICTHFQQPDKQYGIDGKLKMKKPHCNDAGYKIYVTFSSTGKEDLIDNEAITEANWKDAFDWIRIDLECSKCGTRKNVIDLETM
jgi:hypothetical protein